MVKRFKHHGGFDGMEHVMAPLGLVVASRRGAVRRPGAGHHRAEERLQAHREHMARIPDSPVWTRQRDRAEMRRIHKQMRNMRKQAAMGRDGPKGGAAVVS